MSAPLDDSLVIVLAGGAGERLYPLTKDRAKPAVHFGGAYRIIDFALSNCANSSLDSVAVLTQYRPRSLVNHIGAGRAWGSRGPSTMPGAQSIAAGFAPGPRVASARARVSV